MARTSHRISVFLPNLRPGGAERMHITMARQWLHRGFEVDLVLMRRDGELLDVVPEGARVVDLAVDRYRKSLGPIRAYLQRERPVSVLAAMWPLTVASILAARLARTGVRVVVSDHNPLSVSYANRGRLHRQFLRYSMAWVYPLADVRVAVSKGVASDLAMLSGMDVQRFQVIYNPAAVGSIKDLPVPDEVGNLPGPLLLSVGTLKAQKDHDLLIRAFSRLPRELDATLVILGEGELRTELEYLVRQLDLQGRVLLLGFRADTSAWYQHADLFVLSSSYEGFGNVIVEALEHGVPVVSTDCPSGPGEILCGEKYGRLVPVGDAAALAGAMQAALIEPHERQALRARARDFSVEKIADEYLAVLIPDWRDNQLPKTNPGSAAGCGPGISTC